MDRRALAVMVGVVLGACRGGDGAATAVTDPDEAKTTELRDRMCACKDARCATAINVEADAWNRTLVARYKDRRDIPPALAKIGIDMAACLRKLGGGAGGVGEMRDKMCACKDADCASKVMDELSKLGESFGKDYRPSEAEAKAAAEMAECMQKIMR